MSQSAHGAGAPVPQEAGRGGAPSRSRSGGCGRTQAGRWVEAGPPEGAGSSDRTPLAPPELGTGVHRRTFLTQMLNTHGPRWKDTEKPFSPAWLQFAAHTGGVGRLFSLCHVMDTPAPLRVAQRSSRGRLSPAKAAGGASIQDPHRLLRSREAGRSRPPRPAIAAAPLSSTLGGGPRPSREAAPPGGRPGRCPPLPPVVVSKTKAPMGTLCLYPLRRSRSGPRKTVSSSCSATLSACV